MKTIEERLTALEAKAGISHDPHQEAMEQLKPAIPRDNGRYVGNRARIVLGTGGTWDTQLAGDIKKAAKQGRSYQYKENAERSSRMEAAWTELARLAEQHDPDWEADWDNREQRKACLSWDHSRGCPDVINIRYIQYPLPFHCHSSTARWLSENHTDLIAVAFGVEDE